jgi:hypothetical protein
MGEGVENEFTLDLFNRVVNKPRNDLIRQVTEGVDDRKSEHTYLHRTTLRSRWFDENYFPPPAITLLRHG